MIGSALQKSLAAKITAVGFVAVVIAGNLWLTLALVGAPVPTAISRLFELGVLVAVVGGVGIGIAALRRRRVPQGHREGTCCGGRAHDAHP